MKLPNKKTTQSEYYDKDGHQLTLSPKNDQNTRKPRLLLHFVASCLHMRYRKNFTLATLVPTKVTIYFMLFAGRIVPEVTPGYQAESCTL